MLEALINNKINRSISEGKFKPTEDTLTSSVFGILQYLPDDIFWSVMYNGCGECTYDLPETIGNIIRFDFWIKLDSVTYNKVYVEPDVLIETDSFYIVIEAKKNDITYNQDEIQWSKEIAAVNNYSNDKNKKIIFIAIGGNFSCKDRKIKVDNCDYVIHTTSWYNILNSVLKLKETSIFVNKQYLLRALDCIVLAFDRHHIIKTVWLESLCKLAIEKEKTLIMSNAFDFKANESLEFVKFKVNISNLENIWTIK